jgi:hypothetical protein
LLDRLELDDYRYYHEQRLLASRLADLPESAEQQPAPPGSAP